MTRCFFGTPNRLSGRTETLVSVNAEDAFESEWVYRDGLTGQLSGSWSKRDCRKPSLSMRITGSNGQMDVFDDGVELSLTEAAAGQPAGASRLAVTSLERPVPFDLAGPMYTRQMEAWLGSLAGQPLQTNTLEENLTNLRLIDAIRSSGGLDRWTEIP
jgi:predicted dehydrogenase